jgi:resuscitation-promoting factor RpfA
MLGGRLGARRLSAPAVEVGLGVLELALVRLAGPPGRQLEVLRHLGQVGADPLASVLALLALAAEGLTAYLLAVLGLRLLALLPGVVGRLASGAALLVTPASVRRALDLLLGGALLAQATLTPLPARAHPAPPPVAGGLAAATLTPLPARADAAPPRVAGGLAWTRPRQGRPVAPAPLPPWLAERPRAAGGGGPAAEAGGPGPAGRGAVPARRRRATRPPGTVDAGGAHATRVVGAHTVRPGDTLWGIAAAHLPPAWRSPATIDRYWRQVYRANRAVLGPDPDLIHPGTRLRVPRYRPDPR